MFRISRFGELLKLVPRGVFERAVEAHGADRYRKTASCWQQLVAMMYAQMAGASSLRVLESGFNAQRSHHYHLGCGAVRRSTLAELNARVSSEVFGAVAEALMGQVRGGLRQEGRELLRLLDSSSLTLKGAGFDDWTSSTRTGHTQGLKLHVLLGLPEQAPLAAALTEANVNDIEYARRLPVEDGVTYVFDKGYCDYGWWWRLQCEGAHFVTRFKRNARVEVVQSRRIARNAAGLILADETVRLANRYPGGGRRNPYRSPLRRIVVAREGKTPLVLATNDLKSAALSIAARYRARWQVELFFKWIKQHLRIKRFLGRSETAVRTQILTALITYLLVALYAKTHRSAHSLWLLLSELRATLFQRPEADLDRHRRWRQRTALFASQQFGLFT
ncbi:MAG TPA: IS4 family transposase [Thauera aminoaromatica]|nr:IS4 family transposase [Thauera aminoaromatica]